MLLPEDLQTQIRSELAVAELTIVSVPDLMLVLSADAGTATMEQWLCNAAPRGTTVEYHPLRQYFALRREARRGVRRAP